MADHAFTVLAAIVPNRRDLLIHALHHLDSDHFRQEKQRTIFNLLSQYYDIAGDVLPTKTLADILERKGIEEAKQLSFEQLYQEICDAQVQEHEYRYAIDALKDARADQLTGEALVAAFEIKENGLEVDGVQQKGHEAARAYITSEIAKIDRLNHMESAPEGDIRRDGAEVMQQYADRKSGKIGNGILSGISQIDLATGGFMNGELVLLCAYTNQGKSQLLAQIMWHAAIMQGKNVYFATSETSRTQTRRRIIARHSRLPQFNCKDGLNVRDIRDGTLDEKGEQVLKDVIHDLDKNPNYGRLDVAQVPRGATLGFLEMRMKRAATQFEIHVGGMDYLGLLKADRHRGSSYEEKNDLLKDAKVMANSFYEGQGIPFISPWQMSQNAFNAAKTSGIYNLASLSDTSEAEKTPDHIWWLLRYDDSPHEAKLGSLKLRDSEIPEPFTVEVDYRNAFLGQKSGGGAAGSDDDEDDFLSALGG